MSGSGHRSNEDMRDEGEQGGRSFPLGRATGGSLKGGRVGGTTNTSKRSAPALVASVLCPLVLLLLLLLLQRLQETCRVARTESEIERRIPRGEDGGLKARRG